MLSDLSAGTVYHYRLVATNDAGTSYGNEAVFTTPEGTMPTAVTGGANDVSATTATLFGVVETEEIATSYGFEVGEEAGNFGPATGLGEDLDQGAEKCLSRLPCRTFSRALPITTGSSRATSTGRAPAPNWSSPPPACAQPAAAASDDAADRLVGNRLPAAGCGGDADHHDYKAAHACAAARESVASSAHEEAKEAATGMCQASPRVLRGDCKATRDRHEEIGGRALTGAAQLARSRGLGLAPDSEPLTTAAMSTLESCRQRTSVSSLANISRPRRALWRRSV